MQRHNKEMIKEHITPQMRHYITVVIKNVLTNLDIRVIIQPATHQQELCN